MHLYRWVVIAFAFLAIIITYLDRSALAYVIGPIEQQFDLTNAQFGIISSAFGLGYLFMTVRSGVLVDRHGARKTWAKAAVLWSLACAGLGFATGFIGLFVFRLLLGATEGPSFPAFTRVSADWLPVAERTRALAFGLAAVPFASVLGAPLISHLMAWFGWRAMFIILGSSGVFWALIWYFIFRDSPKTSQYVTKDELKHIEMDLDILQETPPPTSWKFMLFNRSLLANHYAFFAFGYLLFFAITWLPGYVEQTFSVHIKTAGWFLMIPWFMATLFILLGGFLSDYLWKKTHSLRISRSYVICACQLLSGICFFIAVFSEAPVILIISISLGLAFGLMPNAAFFVLNTDLVRDRAATSLGIMNSSFALAGILAPLITGFLSDMHGNFTAALKVLAILAITSAFAIFIFQHPDRELAEHRPH